jgi:hypothetical protein
MLLAKDGETVTVTYGLSPTLTTATPAVRTNE